jgi:hypothetical protein
LGFTAFELVYGGTHRGCGIERETDEQWERLAAEQVDIQGVLGVRPYEVDAVVHLFNHVHAQRSHPGEALHVGGPL